MSEHKTNLMTYDRKLLHWRLVEFLLFMMLLGPIIAPLFAHSIWPFSDIGKMVYALGAWICPQPESAFEFGGALYAICYRCLLASVGLTLSRWLYRPGSTLSTLSMRQRFAALALCLLWLELDLYLTRSGFWPVNIPLMVVHGLIYGLCVGGVAFGLLVQAEQWWAQRQQHRAAEVTTSL